MCRYCTLLWGIIWVFVVQFVVHIMEKVFIRLYKRKKNETKNLKVTINYHRARYHTRFNVDEKFFDKESQLILGGVPSYRTINKVLSEMVKRIEDRLAESPMSEKQFLEFCKREFEGNSTPKKAFVDYMDEFIATKTAPKTILAYRYTRSLVYEYDKGLTFESFNLKWLLGFETWMVKRGYMTNGRSIHLRNIRAVCNYCLDNEYTQVYPFRRFTIKNEETKKKSVSIEQIRRMVEMECDETRRQYVDCFMLMLYMRGINASDLFSLTEKNIEDDYIIYRRRKTGRLYHIKIEEEIRDILNRYKGEEHLLIWADTRRADWFMHEMSKQFDKMFSKHITSNSARHTWATIATDLGISKDVISSSLGHIIGSRVTEIYIDRQDQLKIDESNRRVIDYISEKK